MKKNNWRFEALARAKIAQQDEEARQKRRRPRSWKIADDWPPHPADHQFTPNPGGYCIHCHWGRDFS